MRVHFIAIGGAVMHQLAIALKKKGYTISGSDDEIFEPAKSNLEKFNLLPASIGWNAESIDKSLDAVVLGMHAKSDNPELLRSQELGVPIYSYPEFLYELSKNKLRIVVAGSHGKTTITSMIIQILNKAEKKFDYLVGAGVPGLDEMIRISDDAEFIIFEGDEYPDSAVNQLPKFLIYQPSIALISGLAWDHINIYPTFESYLNAFRELIQIIPRDGTLIYNEEDELLKKLVAESSATKISYSSPHYSMQDGQTHIHLNSRNFPLQVFGKHNLQNIMGAVAVCKILGIGKEFSVQALSDFSGATKRMQVLTTSNDCTVILDFAHAPSKVRATVEAVREKFPDRKLVACLELHTFSSLNKDFVSEYKNTLHNADEKIVFYNSHTFQLKNMTMLEEDLVKKSFDEKDLVVITKTENLMNSLMNKNWQNSVLLLMSSGNFGGMDLKRLANFVCGR